MEKRKKVEEFSEQALCAEYEAVYRYVLSLCRTESEAQDITQETFLKALKAKSFSGGSSLYTWLCAIGKNLWRNRCGKLGREVSSEGWEQALPDPSAAMEQRVADRETSFQLHRILHELKEPYKEVFSLRTFGQLSFGEIARLFSKTESWARVTYYRARKMIQETLRKEGGL
ncbi:RNA polymerase sigma factor [Neglectibacter caecimuris]|uniref:RNA polymerase sigma factor n=1 Tax=Neglectibacter caecimuris TaxID=3093658 RepID=UPI002AC89BB5|nr:RNA polymerase sigma factor [Neglectibacter sp. M00184]